MLKRRIEELEEKSNVLSKMTFETPISTVDRNGAFAIGKGLFENITQKEVWIYTNKTIKIDLNHCILFEGEFKRKSYYLLVDNTHYGVELVLGLSFSELWDHLCMPYYCENGTKEETIQNIETLIGKCLIDHIEEMYIGDRRED